MYKKIAEHSQKWTPVLFQNDVALYFEPYWKQENAADMNFVLNKSQELQTLNVTGKYNKR